MPKATFEKKRGDQETFFSDYLQSSSTITTFIVTSADNIEWERTDRLIDGTIIHQKKKVLLFTNVKLKIQIK